jgi:CxxC motif-containing protein
MIKKLTCIECPKGCELFVEIDKNRAVSVTGHGCPKGEIYAVSEIEDPKRILTSVVLGKGLSLKMIPVRTDKPISKVRLFDAMTEIKNIRVLRKVKVGEVIVKNFLNLGVNLIATRDA